MRQRSFGHVLQHIIVMLIVLILLSAATMLLWNWLMPEIAGLPRVNFFQAAGLFILARILFGLVALGMIAPRMMLHKHRQFHGKWRNMDKEERVEFIEKLHSLHSCCGQTRERKDE